MCLEGGAPYPVHRLEQRLSELKTRFAWFTTLSVNYWYGVDSTEPLTTGDADKLGKLLPDVGYVPTPTAIDPLVFWVVPRLGTISAWSTKATEIAHACGLSRIQRLERGRVYRLHVTSALDAVTSDELARFVQEWYDPLTESVLWDITQVVNATATTVPARIEVDVLSQGEWGLGEANILRGLGLRGVDIPHLVKAFQAMGRNPTDVELMMFAQVNSEHCRHHIFNASWTLDSTPKRASLFDCIRHTYAKSPKAVQVAYRDNAAVLCGGPAKRLLAHPETGCYEWVMEDTSTVLKVETHNHPTAISPWPGAATGSGGEIRDELATGMGATVVAGMCGFTVSHLRLPDLPQPWEGAPAAPAHLASPLQIMIDGPLGAAAFNNEFGRPSIGGYFRTFEMQLQSPYGLVHRGYHKPIMIAGGMGQIRPMHVHKRPVPEMAVVIVLGGPGMAIGLGGGAASSQTTSDERVGLDFASVQRANPEMQRRAYEVIRACIALGDESPLLTIHDVGAGGLSNAIPEVARDAGLGVQVDLRAIPSAEPGMSALAVWCNESQERFVLAVLPEAVSLLEKLAARERCPMAVVGRLTEAQCVTVEDTVTQDVPVDMPFDVLFEGVPSVPRHDQLAVPPVGLTTAPIEIAEAVMHVLHFPAVGDKQFLITMGDRTVGGLVTRDPLVGPWQVAVADVGVVCSDFEGYAGEAMTMGERSPIAVLHSAAAARMAVGEAITNLAAAPIAALSSVVLSANWMAAADHPGEGAALYEAVEAIGMELCPALGIAIPVGKDSLSMQVRWADTTDVSGKKTHQVVSPVSLVITAVAPVSDVRRVLTPELSRETASRLLLIDLGCGAHALGGSTLMQVYGTLGHEPPDVDNPALLKHFFQVIQALNHNQFMLAYHDRSDGGLLATIAEMMFASHVGVSLDLSTLGDDPIAALFTEELGAVIQVREHDVDAVLNILEGYGLEACTHNVGWLNTEDVLHIVHRGAILYRETRVALHRAWSATSYHIQRLRENPETAKEAYDQLLEVQDRGLIAEPTFNIAQDIAAPYVKRGIRPRVAIVREQGINGYVEMAAAFDRVGFEAVDVHMSDIASGRVSLKEMKGLVACGGFSYGDVLGAGRGWAQSIIQQDRVRALFRQFFERIDTFTLGVCNGCQMLSQLTELIPGSEAWPTFERNRSEQFEARLVNVEVCRSPSLFFQGMEGSILPIVVSHGEGRAVFASSMQQHLLESRHLIALRYVDSNCRMTERYPANPNGSPQGIAGCVSEDGRVTLLMPHPERVFRTVQLSFAPRTWGEDSPWLRMFRNARVWVG
ncbi:MAG: phosphoribosylformylglycinamidine synthase [Gammaproteobacteria bacterium RIFCSPHIGHO2_12_FULL_45_9]|nr:MAG: phosphoribosylformylglycinamidine synthase [Gammaproteobacteria bacterium RIFCSPHIGHO2_12_FULL_45_9]